MTEYLLKYKAPISNVAKIVVKLVYSGHSYNPLGKQDANVQQES